MHVFLCVPPYVYVGYLHLPSHAPVASNTSLLVMGLYTCAIHTGRHAHLSSRLSAYSSRPSPIALIATSCKEKPQTPVKAEPRQGCMCGFSSPQHFCSWDSHLGLHSGSTVLTIRTPVVTGAVMSASQVSGPALGCSGGVGEG